MDAWIIEWKVKIVGYKEKVTVWIGGGTANCQCSNCKIREQEGE